MMKRMVASKHLCERLPSNSFQNTAHIWKQDEVVPREQAGVGIPAPIYLEVMDEFPHGISFDCWRDHFTGEWRVHLMSADMHEIDSMELIPGKETNCVLQLWLDNKDRF